MNTKYIDYLNQLGEIAKRGIPVQMNSATEFEVGGFYKSGTVFVHLLDDVVVARYGETSTIHDGDLIQTLVDINYDWWQRSKSRHAGWNNPDEKWAVLMQEYGLLKIDTVLTTVYTLI